MFWKCENVYAENDAVGIITSTATDKSVAQTRPYNKGNGDCP
jgi:hypothetical protein